MDAAGQLTQLVHRVAKLRRGLLEPSAELGVVRLRHPPRLLEPHRDARQVLLGSVMEGSLDAPALCVARSHEPDARGAQLGQLRAQEPSELLVLDVAARASSSSSGAVSLSRWDASAEGTAGRA